MAKGQELIESPTAKKIGRAFVAWVMRKFAGDDEAPPTVDAEAREAS